MLMAMQYSASKNEQRLIYIWWAHSVLLLLCLTWWFRGPLLAGSSHGYRLRKLVCFVAITVLVPDIGHGPAVAMHQPQAAADCKTPSHASSRRRTYAICGLSLAHRVVPVSLALLLVRFLKTRLLCGHHILQRTSALHKLRGARRSH